ncbi:unnamed protein product [Lactuca virosa]|uniref:Uncharacterized protein n=1 Tax=Lactuca virosa TaxID=75947 RepID=A0AAU9MW26_9ASTR|nr:unnamed protein product [Lactuca virosa]
MAFPNMVLKLLVQRRTQKVLFAEATKEFVDFLLHIFSLPLGTLIQLPGSNQMVGSLGQLKESVEILNQAYFQPGIRKDDIVNPKTTFNGNMLLLLNDASMDDEPYTPKTLYRCSYNIRSPGSGYNNGRCNYICVSENPDVVCPSCGALMNFRLTPAGPPKKDDEAAMKEAERKKVLQGGYVKEVVTYMVMDNLVVKPMSTISSITLINSFGVNDLNQLEEKLFSFGNDEALELLKASLMTDQVLTILFRQME